MQLVLLGMLISMALASEPDGLNLPAAGPWTPLALAGYIVITAMLGVLSSAGSLRAIGPPPALAPRALRGLARIKLLMSGWLLVGAIAVHVCGYAQWGSRLANIPLLPAWLAVLPFLTALTIAWATAYPTYLAMRYRICLPDRLRAWTLRQYIAYNLRHNMLFILAPFSLLQLSADVLLLYVAPALPDALWSVALLAGLTILTFLTVLLVMPAIIVGIWRTAPLPAGELGDDLQRLAARLRFRIRSVRIWQTEGTIANAMAMGLLRRFRYILLSDALMEQMPAPCVRAIFAHEAGHVMEHHLFYLMLLIGDSLAIVSAGTALLTGALGFGELEAGCAMLTLLLAGGWFGFGWVSRRFERQSDVIAAWAVGLPHQADPGAAGSDAGDDGAIRPEGAAMFARSLEMVALMNGLPATKFNWRHGSIASRVAYVLWLGSTGRSRRDIDRTVRRIKLGIWALTLTAAAVVGLSAWLGAI